jgi:poly-gamma-glutamate synthesis protein (capsule biosynthesis protein)
MLPPYEIKSSPFGVNREKGRITMDNRRKTSAQLRAERQKYARIQRLIRLAAILLALILSIVALCQSCRTQKAIEDLAAQLRAKKIAQAQEELLAIEAAQESPAPSTAPAVTDGQTVTISLIGDCTLASEEDATYAGSFQNYYDTYGASYFFGQVKSLFEGDDLTVASLESTFTLSDNRADKEETFKADPSYADILTAGGIDVVSIANDHTHDYGNESYVDTLANLDNAGVGRFGYENTLLVQVSGISVGLTGVWEEAVDTDYQAQLMENIQALQDQGAQLVIAYIHWGDTTDEAPSDEHITLAHQAIDAGADLVVGSHPQLLQSIERYHGRYIAYSLGGFCVGAEDPGEYDTLVLQQTFTLVDGVCQDDPVLDLIPCTISSQENTNDYCPTLATGEAAQAILDKVYARSDLIDGGIRQS